MEMANTILLMIQLFFILRLWQMNRQITRQIKKMTEQTETAQKTEEKVTISKVEPVKDMEEKNRNKTKEQERLLSEVLSEVFPS